MDLLQKKADCCGCGACAQKCPNDCIAMKADAEGFAYPEIDPARCTDCGACKAACYFYQEHVGVTEVQVLAAKNKDEEIRYHSASGGIFTLLAEAVAEQGGVVFGAGFDEHFEVCHSAAYTKDELQKFRKSKYSQSDTRKTFIEAERNLKSGKQVLFSGTPCQIMGLKSFLGKDYDNLFTVDLICHGVSSPKVWRMHLDSIQNEAESKAASIVIRDKEFKRTVLSPNQSNMTMRVLFENGNESYRRSGLEHDQDCFFAGFLRNLYLRPSCHQCPARGFNSGSDVQLGDFWGIGKLYPEFCDKHTDGTMIPFGVSEVILITEKGKALFETVKDKTALINVDRYNLFLKRGPGNWFMLFDSVRPHPNRDAFFAALSNSASAPVDDLIREYIVPHDKTPKKNLFGLFGSYASRAIFHAPAGIANLQLGFQFRGSNVISIMSPPAELPPTAKLPRNASRAQMIRDDFSKEFAVSFAEYAKEVQYICIDFLEERFIPIRVGDSYITKSNAFLDAAGISGIPLEEDCIELWEEKCLKFIDMLKSCFSPDRIFLCQLNLNEKFVDAGNSYYHEGAGYRGRVNVLLQGRYAFFKKNFPGVNVISLPRQICFTDKYHKYGCLPEHYNQKAYQHLADKICGIIAQHADVPAITGTPKSDARRFQQPKATQNTAESNALQAAHRFSSKYMTLRDWMYKKSISRPIHKYLKDNGYHEIAIYGMGEIGWLFLWEMKEAGIKVSYAIDRNTRNLFSEIPLKDLSDELPKVDAVIVCIPSDFYEVKQMLITKTDAPVFSINKLIFEA